MEHHYEREKSLIVPLIFTLFCLCVTIGGVLLVIHVFFPALSQPWQPIAAFVLIGSTWIFWILTCLYACFKACFRRCRCRCRDRQIPVAQTPRNIPPAAHDGGGGGGHQQDGAPNDSSFASSTDSETPLTYVTV